MKKNILFLFLLLMVILFSCDDVLDRPQLNSLTDNKINWEKEDFSRNFSYGFYTHFFPGYGQGWTLDYQPLRGFTFSDDVVTQNKQPIFENSVPTSRGGSSWLSSYNGPNWYFGWIRKANIWIDRLESYSKDAFAPEAYKHWMGIARFFRGLEYASLVGTFGDMPYYDKLLKETETDFLYKDRDPRSVVMDKVLDDFNFAIENVRAVDEDQTVNKYVVAAFAARWMLFEGTWQKYHENNQELATKYLSFAQKAAEVVMNSGKFAIVSDFRTLFGSMSLAGNKDCVFYRHYDIAESVTHPVASYCCGYESQGVSANLSLLKSFICNDGKVWNNSDVDNAKSFKLEDLALTRDPRFEASFWDKPMVRASSFVMCWKFVDRVGPTYESGTPPTEYNGATNPNDYPVMRYSEVLLNWIEAKAELASMGKGSVNQEDIDHSINAIRNRPLDKIAIEKGVKKTAPMSLESLPQDPARDADVPALIWEIRRERRMEFVFEYSRLNDIRRWKKLSYMDADKNPDILMSVWIDFKKDAPSFLEAKRVGILTVYKEDGTPVVYNGNNGDEMVGFYRVYNSENRDLFTDRAYLSPVGKAQIDEYSEKGYTLTQTKGW